jgi:site-specific DNA-cytosine methylase
MHVERFILMMGFVEAFKLEVDLVAASDKKPASRKFILQNHDFTHLFKSADDHIRGRGYCEKHGQICELNCGVDLVCGGLSCHPFSHMKQRTGTSARTSRPCDHPDYILVMEGFPEFLKNRRPGGFIVEEVEAILDRIPSSQKRYIDLLVENCVTAGYACRARVIQHSDWIQWPRSRQAESHSIFTESTYVNIQYVYIYIYILYLDIECARNMVELCCVFLAYGFQNIVYY